MQKRIIIHATSSRLSKGLLAIPQRYKSLFPSQPSTISVRFDRGARTKELTFKPYDSQVKEARLFGLGRWFSKAGVQDGDPICIVVEDQEHHCYRIALQRVILAEDEANARTNLQEAPTEAVAAQEFRNLARITRRRPIELAREEVLRVATATRCKPRPRIVVPTANRSEGVPPGLRLLLRAFHEGKCQLCSFTFEKRDGEPYFEIHHLDAKLGHHPHNLLVLCANCHAQLEHAAVTDFAWAGSWLIGLTINGRRVCVRQPLAPDLSPRSMLGIALIFAAQMGPMITLMTSK